MRFKGVSMATIVLFDVPVQARCFCDGARGDPICTNAEFTPLQSQTTRDAIGRSLGRC